MGKFIQVSKNIVTQTIDDNVLILEKSGKHVILLNDTASKIFDLIGDGSDLSTIVNLLQQEYNDESNSIKHDVEEIIKYFLSKGIIVCLDHC